MKRLLATGASIAMLAIGLVGMPAQAAGDCETSDAEINGFRYVCNVHLQPRENGSSFLNVARTIENGNTVYSFLGSRNLGSEVSMVETNLTPQGTVMTEVGVAKDLSYRKSNLGVAFKDRTGNTYEFLDGRASLTDRVYAYSATQDGKNISQYQGDAVSLQKVFEVADVGSNFGIDLDDTGLSMTDSETFRLSQVGSILEIGRDFTTFKRSLRNIVKNTRTNELGESKTMFSMLSSGELPVAITTIGTTVVWLVELESSPGTYRAYVSFDQGESRTLIGSLFGVGKITRFEAIFGGAVIEYTQSANQAHVVSFASFDNAFVLPIVSEAAVPSMQWDYSTSGYIAYSSFEGAVGEFNHQVGQVTLYDTVANTRTQIGYGVYPIGTQPTIAFVPESDQLLISSEMGGTWVGYVSALGEQDTDVVVDKSNKLRWYTPEDETVIVGENLALLSSMDRLDQPTNPTGFSEGSCSPAFSFSCEPRLNYATGKYEVVLNNPPTFGYLLTRLRAYDPDQSAEVSVGVDDFFLEPRVEITSMSESVIQPGDNIVLEGYGLSFATFGMEITNLDTNQLTTPTLVRSEYKNAEGLMEQEWEPTRELAFGSYVLEAPIRPQEGQAEIAEFFFTVSDGRVPSVSAIAGNEAVVGEGLTVTLTGENLDLATQVGYTAPGFLVNQRPLTSQTDTQLTFTVSDAIAVGEYTIYLYYGNNERVTLNQKLIITEALAEVPGEVTPPAEGVDTEFKVWTKRISDTEVKMYAKNPIGQGKIQMRVNGEERAWIRAADINDPKLRVVTEGPMTGASYLVRTIILESGKNAFEFYQDGERIRRNVYSY